MFEVVNTLKAIIVNNGSIKIPNIIKPNKLILSIFLILLIMFIYFCFVTYLQHYKDRIYINITKFILIFFTVYNNSK